MAEDILPELLKNIEEAFKQEFEKDPKYLLIFLNKLFEMENNLPVNNYINSERIVNELKVYTILEISNSNSLEHSIAKRIKLSAIK